MRATHGRLTGTGLQRRSLGAYLQLAQDVSQICAFTCFDRSSALVATDDEPVPSGGPGMSICYVSTGSYDVNTGNYVNTGGGARLVLAADPGVLKITCPTTPVSCISSASGSFHFPPPPGNCRCATSSNRSPPLGSSRAAAGK